ELLKQLGGNGRQVYRLGFRFARHTSSFGASYALNTKLLTGPRTRVGPREYARAPLTASDGCFPACWMFNASFDVSTSSDAMFADFIKVRLDL
ncbi:hypothetical protein, partial [Burkholderia aenigmatica]|uniref:hypothetical protein n=1 Tax=Burkholderia aenigmatica TaxID=2015348 RepID=UPI00264F0D50